MNKNCKLKFLTFSIIVATITTIGTNVSAHTRLEIPQIVENTRVSNNIVIGHGCAEDTVTVLGNSVVFPDGVDSTITVDGQPYAGTLTDFVPNWTNANKKIQSRALFNYEGVKTDSLGNLVGFWSGGDDTDRLQSNHLGYIPFRTSAVIIEPTSCAISVTFTIAIADICEITGIAGFSDNAVNLWTPAVNSSYDGSPGSDGYNSPATLTVNRNLATNPLPSSCGAGSAVTVTPSAAQINRDMPISDGSKQIWPQQ